MGFVELVVFLAITMALNALAIDIVLPGLPHIGADLGVVEDNHRQLVIVVYLVSLGAAQLVQGPLADRLGRRATLLLSAAVYTLAGAACALAPTFEALLAARARSRGLARAGCAWSRSRSHAIGTAAPSWRG